MNEQGYWNRIYSSSDKKLDSKWIYPFLRVIPNRSSILDLGCGEGELGELLLNSDHKVTGLDISSEAVKKATTSVPSGKWLVHDLHEGLPFEDKSFQVVVASLSLHYFTDDILKNITDEIGRVLSNNGLLIFRMNSSSDPEASSNGEIPRFYFSQDEMCEWLSEWKLGYMNERSLMYCGKPKVLWEGFAMRGQLTP